MPKDKLAFSKTVEMMKFVHRVVEKKQVKSNSKSKSIQCFSCGRKGHKSKDRICPAKDKKCRKCHYKGHFEKYCRTKREGRHSKEDELHQVEDADYAFSLDEGRNRMGKVQIQLGGVKIDVIIDSGASRNVIDRNTWELLKDKNIKVSQSSKCTSQLYSYGGQKPLATVGCFLTCIEYNGKALKNVEFVVIEGKEPSLLGRQTSTDLGILKLEPCIENPMNVNALDSCLDLSHCEKLYPTLFKGVGRLKNFKLKIPIDKSVQPIVQPLRRVPYQLRNKLEEKLLELESLDLIEKCVGPSNWVSPLVCVPKPNGELSLCRYETS